MTERPSPAPRNAYRHFETIATRWMDNDVYGHVNNVVHYSLFDTAVNRMLIQKGVLDIHGGGVIGLVVHTQCHYFDSIAFPQTVHAGVKVLQLGRSSVRYQLALFADEATQSAALGEFTHVYVDRATRRPVPLPDALRAALEPLTNFLKAPCMNSAPDKRAPVTPATTAAADEAITSRRSIRAFRNEPVPRDLIEQILAVASRAASGTNTQPWQVHVLTGAAKASLSRDIRAAYDDPEERARHSEPYAYYPTQWQSPYIDRRRKVGWDLYGLLGIGKADKTRMHEQHAKNYDFFGAPVGLMFSIDRVMQQGSWLDYGMFLQSVMVAARARGLDTCPQAAFTQFHRIIARHLALGEDQTVVCGMSLGYADPAAVENTLVTEREPVAGFARFLE